MFDSIAAVVVSPIVETFLLAGLLRVLSSTSLAQGSVVAMAALLWGLAHGLFGALWFFGTVFSFGIYSYSYLAWRRISFWQAWLAAAVPHVLVNGIATAAFLA
ncbi:hypothetical protein BH09PSE6_BH09PSE6_09710 [soil metagenome]